MEHYTAILIECDNTRSLGGSCERDIRNISEKLISKNVSKENIFILTNKNNSISELEKILQKKISHLYIHISGHGYQGSNINCKDIDGSCEQIVLSSGTFNDFQFNDMLTKYLSKDTIVRVAVDTCHSGTFSNFRYQITKDNKKIEVTRKNNYFLNAYSISACKDTELDSCDIGNIGFGGSLTVHLLDNNNFEEFILGSPIKVRDNLINILGLLNQEPILLVDN
jgi:hypothetical protein